MRRAFVYANTDGVANLYHGSGILLRSIIETWDELQKGGSDVTSRWDVHVAVHDWDVVCPGYETDAKILQSSHALAAQAGVSLHKLSHDPDSELWGYRKWEELATSAARLLGNLCEVYDQVVFMGVDVPYCLVEEICAARLSPDAYQRILFTVSLHTLATIDGQIWILGRRAIEAELVRRANCYDNVFLTSLAPYFDRQIVRDYGAGDSAWMSLGHGLSLVSDDLRRVSREEAVRIVEEYGVPLDKPILVHFGRRDPQKRISFMIKAVAKLKVPFHLVLIAGASGPRSDSAELHLEELEQSVGSFTYIPYFDRRLPRALAALRETRAFLLSARGEPVGQIPMEIACWGVDEGPLVVAPNHGGYADQIFDEETGLTFDVESASSFADAIGRAIDLPDDERQTIIANLRVFIRQNKDAQVNLAAFLKVAEQFFAGRSVSVAGSDVGK